MEGNITIYLREIWWEGLNWICLTQEPVAGRFVYFCLYVFREEMEIQKDSELNGSKHSTSFTLLLTSS
jgi:hypothetical protein